VPRARSGWQELCATIFGAARNKRGCKRNAQLDPANRKKVTAARSLERRLALQYKQGLRGEISD
jgi:hypothetical protein